jgi:hypothetical protein
MAIGYISVGEMMPAKSKYQLFPSASSLDIIIIIAAAFHFLRLGGGRTKSYMDHAGDTRVVPSFSCQKNALGVEC